MENDRISWFINSEIFKYLKLPGLTWLEVVLIAVGLSALSGYFLMVLFLDERLRSRWKKAKEMAQLRRWLEDWRPIDEQMDLLREMAADETDEGLYAFLDNPVAFETQVDQAFKKASAVPMEFLERIRYTLKYYSGNPRVKLVSSRQFRENDPVRLAVWEAGRPQHFYGRVGKVDAHNFTLLLPQAGIVSINGKGSEVDLFFLRENDSEYAFPFLLHTINPQENKAILKHTLVRRNQTPRPSRLPLLMDISYRSRPSEADVVADLDPSTTPSDYLPGTLLDISEGGFALISNHPVPPGEFTEFTMPPRWRGRAMPLVGEVLECRDFPGDQLLIRCKLVNLTPADRNYLQQMIRVSVQRALDTWNALQEPAASARESIS